MLLMIRSRVGIRHVNGRSAPQVGRSADVGGTPKAATRSLRTVPV